MFYLCPLCFFFWSQTALAAIIIVNLVGMFKQFRDICALWRTSKIELVCLSTNKYICWKKALFLVFFLTVLLPLFSLAGYLAGGLSSIGVTGARLRPPGGHHIRLNDGHLQNTKVPGFFFSWNEVKQHKNAQQQVCSLCLSARRLPSWDTSLALVCTLTSSTRRWVSL